MIEKDKIYDLADGVRDTLGEDTQVTVFVKKKKPRIPDFVMMFQGVNVALARELSPVACKVLMYLIGKLVYGNYIGVDIETIKEDLDYKSKTSIITAMNELVERNIVIRIKDTGDKRRNVYYVNPYQSWKGNWKDRLSAINFLEENRIDNERQLAMEYPEDHD